MTNTHPEDPSGTPIAEVVAYRNGQVIARRTCDNEREAAAIAAHWEEQPGVECELTRLSSPPDETGAEIIEPDTLIDYPVGEHDESG